jgi:1-acyl-sn-glycerol-3-phosphate acyltransferase
MSIQAQAPIVTVAIQGGRAAMKKGSAFVRPVRESVRIGKPISTAGLALEDRDRLIEEVRAAVERLLQEGTLW